MTLTREFLAEIVAKSSTFDERLANGYFLPRAERDQSEIDRRLERWREIAAKGDHGQFHKLLLLKGLDLGSIQLGLGPVRVSDEARLPDWTDLLQAGLSRAAARAAEPPRFLNAAEHWLFEQIVAPFVFSASSKVRVAAGRPYERLADTAHASLERKLLHWLVNICSGALMLEFSIFRLKREPAFGRRLSQILPDSSNEIYQEFCEQMLTGGLITFFQEYSALARAVATAMRNWIDAVAEFLSRLASDVDNLAQEFNAGQEVGRVEDISAGLSDPHRGGRSVFALTFSSGLKLVYKPKSIDTEQAYTRLVEWINSRGLSLQLKGLHVLSQSNYGWAEFVEHGPPASDIERARFYRRSGMLLCLLYVLGSTDVHAENLIAAGEHPVLVDAETLITPAFDENNVKADEYAEKIAARKLNASVLQVGMLPWCRSWGAGQLQDLSALGGVGGENFSADGWEGIATDNVRRQVVTGKTPRNRNVPFAPDEKANPANYVEEVVAGFHEMYDLLLVQRDALLQVGSPLSELVRSPMRLVFRDTSTYFSILKNSMDAALLRDGVDRSIHLELLSRVLLVSDSNARFAPFLKTEQEALTNLDIPFFTISPESRAIDVGNGKCVQDCFPQAGYERVCQKLSSLEIRNREEQIRIIRGSFWAKAVTQACSSELVEAASITSPADEWEPAADDLMSEAIKLAHFLKQEAIQGGDGSLTWVGVFSQAGIINYRFGQLGPALFDGLAGITLFGAALTNICGDVAFRDLVLGPLGPIRRSLDAYKKLLQRSRKSPQEPTPGLTGVGSIVYALTRAGQLLKEEPLLDVAQTAATLFNTGLLARDNSTDVFSGYAGGILGLLALYKVRSEIGTLEMAIECGDRILKWREGNVDRNRPAAQETGGPAASFARGAAGVAHALLQLYRATDQERFLNAGKELMAATYSGQTVDLPDTNWITGAAGLGLSWLRNLDALGDSRYRSGVDIALQRCLHASPAGCDQVCSGMAGSLDFLIEASQRTHFGSDVLAMARKQAGSSITRANRDGGFRLHSHLPAGAFLAGFYDGAAGLGYQFLRLAFPEKLPSVLLWD